MEQILSALSSLAVNVAGKIVLAVIILAVGSFLIKKLLKLLKKSRFINRLEGTAQTFTLSFFKIGLYVLLVISVITILGVPTASIVTVLASAGVAIGLALQGALSNLTGGIMLVIFKPFKLGDFVTASDVSGTVIEVSLFYTVLLTPDNRKVTVPNGNLMNTSITDYSSEEFRRVDLAFSCSKTESPSKVQDIIMNVLKSHEKVLSAPSEPFARLSGGTNEAMEFAARVWCKNADYWDVYFDITQKVTEAFAENGIRVPAVAVRSESDK